MGDEKTTLQQKQRKNKNAQIALFQISSKATNANVQRGDERNIGQDEKMIVEFVDLDLLFSFFSLKTRI